MIIQDPQLHAVILAGGSGQRFWPLSRELNPKQLLTMFGTESLISQAVHRILPFTTGSSAISIATNERLFDELRNHLKSQPDPALHGVRYIEEPVPRNTAPAIALAAAIIATEDPDAVLVVLPSDHVLEGGAGWADCVNAATGAARDGYLVTIGITPTRPETGYGYIRAGEPLPVHEVGSALPHVAAEFVEKPELARAQEFVERGRHYWNAGIFVMKAAQVLEELVAAGPAGAAIADCARWIAEQPAERRIADEARERFAALEPLSIDKAVMERSDRVAVIPASLAWSDVGSLLALGEIAAPDAAGNVRVGRGVDVDSSNTIVYSGDRLVATLGVSDLIVVDTADATLVLPKDRAQDVRHVFDALKLAGVAEVTESRTSLRPWGSWTLLMRGDGFQIKSVDVLPGQRLSLQSHAHRSEHWVVIDGEARVTCDERVLDLVSNESAYLPAGCVHRLENPGVAPLKVIEVAVGDYLGEDDITRYQDDWDREKPRSDS